MALDFRHFILKGSLKVEMDESYSFCINYDIGEHDYEVPPNLHVSGELMKIELKIVYRIRL